MPLRDYAMLAGAILISAMLTLFAWMSGQEMELPIRFASHTGWFLAIQLIGGFGLLRKKAWGYTIYSLLTLGIVISTLMVLFLDLQLGANGGPPLIQYPTAIFMAAATLLARSHGLNDGE